MKEQYEVIFTTPNGIRWYVKYNSYYARYLRIAICALASDIEKEEPEHVGSK